MGLIEQVREFNDRLNKQKLAVQRAQAQLEMAENDLVNKLSELSRLAGRPLDENNIEAYYNEVEEAIKKQLENGNDILNRIEGKAPTGANQAQQGVGGTPKFIGTPQGVGGTPQSTVPMQSAPVQTGFQRPVQPQGTPQAPQGYGYQQPTQPQIPQGYGYQQPVQPVQPQAPQGYGYQQPVQRVQPQAQQQTPTLGNMGAQNGISLDAFNNGGVVSV